MEKDWERIHLESKRTLIALLNYIATGVVIFGAIVIAYFANKDQPYHEIHNRIYAIMGMGMMVSGTLGYFNNKLTKKQKTFTSVFSKSVLAFCYSTGTFCITVFILKSS
jgi:hypothetical protein